MERDTFSKPNGTTWTVEQAIRTGCTSWQQWREVSGADGPSVNAEMTAFIAGLRERGKAIYGDQPGWQPELGRVSWWILHEC